MTISVRAASPFSDWRSRMSRSSHLIMCIDAKLKAALRKHARRDGYSLSKHVERELLLLLPPSTKTRKGQAAARQPRGAHLAIRVGRDLKVRMERLAAEEYRTLASFVEIQLHAIVAAYEKNPIRPPRAVERRRHLGPDWQPRRSRVATSLSVQLKTQLKKLADEDYRELGNFIEVELGHLAATHIDHSVEPVMQRRPRSARLVVRVSNQLKARLQSLADEDNRSLTDFTEIRLRKIVTNRHRRLLTDDECKLQAPNEDFSSSPKRHRQFIKTAPELVIPHTWVTQERAFGKVELKKPKKCGKSKGRR